jgi:hypothetical protein
MNKGGFNMEPNRNDKKTPDSGDKRPKKNILFALVIAIALVILISTVFNAVRNSQYSQTTFSDFMTEWENNNLKEVEIQSDRILYLTKTEWEKPAAQLKACHTGLPSGDRLALARELEADGWIASVSGKGSFVCGAPRQENPEAEALWQELDAVTAKLTEAGISRQAILQYLKQGGDTDA